MAEPKDLRVEVVEGVIANFKADVVVNSTNRGLQLNVGGLSKSILSAAGPALQDEVSRTNPGGLELGKLVVTAGHKLAAGKVYHGALPAWDTKERNVNPRELLCEFICACLEQAHADGARSIALPTLGCGFLNYPHNEVAMTMCQCIAIFKSMHEDTSLQKIFIVVYTKGQDWRHIKQAFLQELGFARVEKGKRGDGPLAQRFSAAKIGAARAVNMFGKRVLRNDVRKEDVLRRKRAPQTLLDTCMREQAHNSCKNVLRCGHVCPGVKNEKSCPPCLQPDCPGLGALRQAAEDDCTICYTDVLSAAPVIQLKCGHMYHHHCVRRVLDNRWVGARITFSFLSCPMCKKSIEHPLLDDKLKPLLAIKDDVRRKAVMRLQYEGLDKSADVTSRDSPYFQKPEEFAIDRYCYYPCFKCKQAYFGGVVQCEAGAGDREFESKDLVCPSCSNPDPQQTCSSHGNDYLEFKCRFCCSVAVFFCFGTTHFCNTCHDNYYTVTRADVNTMPKCPVGPVFKQLAGKCPLNVKHPATGTEFALGCGICKNTQSF